MSLTKVTYAMIEDAPVNVADYIPPNITTSTTDCSSYFNLAIQEAAGERAVFIPAGTYLISNPIELNWSTATTPLYQSGTKLIGQSAIDVVILNRSGDYGLQHTVSSAQAAASVRMANGVISNLTISHDGSSPADSAGIKLFSFWYGTLENVYISGADGHGIYLPVDNALNPNPDTYSCGSLFVKTCDIRSSTGWGIKAELWSITWNIQTNYIVNNELGGIYTTGSGHQMIGNAVAGNGTEAGASTAAGIHIAYGGVGTPHNIYIRETELQENWGQHLILEGYNHRVFQNRMLQDGTAGAGGSAFRNTYCVKVDATASGSANNIQMNDNLVRLDNAGSETLTGFYVVNAAGTENVSVTNTIWSSTPVGLTKYNFPSVRNRIYATEGGLQLAGSGGQVQYNFNQTTVVTALSTLMTTAGALLQFDDIYDPLTRWFGGSGDPNQMYVPLFSGVLKIDATLLLRQTTTGTAITIAIYKNGSSVQTFEWPNGFPTTDDYTVSFSHVMKVDGGDEIEIYGISTTAAASYSISGGQTVTFQML